MTEISHSRNLHPLRKVVDFYMENGVRKERLECGHIINTKQDIYGNTYAYRRRCRRCTPL